MPEAKTIGEMTVAERQDLLAAVADGLDQSAREALEAGDQGFALNSHSLASMIRGSTEDLSRHELQAAELLLQQGIAMIDQFRTRLAGDPHSTLH